MSGRIKGLIHLANSGTTTWYGFAREVLRLSGYDRIEVAPVSSAEFETAAKRPAYSVLDCSRAQEMGVVLRSWQEALQSYLECLGQEVDAGSLEGSRAGEVGA